MFLVQIQITPPTETHGTSINVVAGHPIPGGLEPFMDPVTILRALDLAREAILGNANFGAQKKIVPGAIVPRFNGR